MAINIIEVTEEAGNLLSQQFILKILHHIRNITCLTLRLLYPAALCRLSIAHDQIFHNLTCLNVNVSHAFVAPFLINHPFIIQLTLGTCHTLKDSSLMDSFQPFLQKLLSPSSCAISLGTCLTWLISIHDSLKDTIFPILPILRAIGPSATLTVLDLDYLHTLMELLQLILAAAPALMVLWLKESSFIVKV